MKHYYQYFLSLIFVVVTIAMPAVGQQVAEPLPTDNSLSGQFKALRDGSNSFKQYKVIDKTKLNGFWASAQDSIGALQKKITMSNAQIEELQGQIESLQQSISAKDKALGESTFEKEHIKVVGIDFAKGTYITINFTLIFALLAVLGFFIYKHDSSNKITIKSKQEFSKLSEEFESFKKDSLEKQMKLRRELQTERNKVEELYQKVGSYK